MLNLIEIHDLLIWSFFAGFCIALLYAYYVKHVVGSFVRHLIENGCFSEDTAQEAPMMNAFDGSMLKLALRKGSALYDTVGVFSEDKYYVYESKKEKAKSKYKGDIKLWHVVAAAALLFAAALLISYFFEGIAKAISDFLNSVIDGFRSIGKGGGSNE